MENVNFNKYQISSMKRQSNRALKIIGLILVYVGLILLALIFLFPIIWMVSNSLKTEQQYYETLTSLKTFLPYTWKFWEWFASYKKLFTSIDNFGQSVLNSILYCSIVIVMVLIVNSLAGYALSRFKFPGSKLLVNIIIIILLVPVETSIVPLFIILKNLGLMTEQTRVLGYLIPSFCSPYYIFMFRNYFLGIPKELEESALLDGANHFKAFFRVILPCSLPVFATVAIFTFMGQWNEYVFAQFMFTDESRLPLQAFLQIVINSDSTKDMSVMMAALTFSTLPIAFFYIFCQRYIVEGVAFTGLK